MFRLRQRSCMLLITALVLTPCAIILIIIGPGPSTEQTLTQRLAECHMRLQYLETMYHARQEDVALLSQYLGLTQNQLQQQQQQQQQSANITSTATATATVTTSTTSTAKATSNLIASSINNKINENTHGQQSQNRTSSSSNGLVTGDFIAGAAGLLFDALSPETRQFLRDATHSQSAHRLISAASMSAIRLPTAYHFLPHLLDDPNSLRPSFRLSKGRNDVSIVLGVPTVRREKQSYLLSTLKNLIENMNEEEQNETLIIVFIGETDPETVHLIAKELQIVLEPQIEAGLIDIIAPSPAYYPEFDHLRTTLNDSIERVKWRSKQNLDFAYLMAYAQPRGTFYVQLEDDILAKRNFITLMKKFAITKSALTKPDQPSWLVLDFCQLGFIGKMFKSADLPYLITFFQMFYSDKPVDWLLVSFLESKICRIDKDQKHCNLEKGLYWLHYRPSLFQHIGMSSSLKGKVQKLKDKQFRWKVPAYYAHTNNPPALVKTNIAPYRNYLLKRAYIGETYFWGLLPQPGDLVQFIFEQPIQLRRYLFRSGNSEHPSDRFYNTTVEVLPADSLSENSPVWSLYNSTTDGYLVVGTFDAMGFAEGMLDIKIGAIKELRLHVHGDSENWVLLSEIDLQTAEMTAAGASALVHSSVTAEGNDGGGGAGAGTGTGRARAHAVLGS